MEDHKLELVVEVSKIVVELLVVRVEHLLNGDGDHEMELNMIKIHCYIYCVKE